MNNYIEGLVEGIHRGDKIGFEREKAPLISNYQRRLMNFGWIHVINENVKDYIMEHDHPREPLKNSLRRIKDDFEKKFCHNKKVEFFRAYDIFGERIPYPVKIEFLEGFENIAMVGIYVKDRE